MIAGDAIKNSLPTNFVAIFEFAKNVLRIFSVTVAEKNNFLKEQIRRLADKKNRPHH
jgi:hypothetical protein